MSLRAALDIGSNTIRLLVVEVDGNLLRFVHDQSEFVRLGRGVQETGLLASDRWEAGLCAIQTLHGVATQFGVNNLVAFATSAIRDARNGTEFAKRVSREIGTEVAVLSGEQEARLTYLGATIGRHVEGGILVADIGGGSAEFIAADDTSIWWAESLALGSGRLSETFIHRNPVTAQEIAALMHFLDTELTKLPDVQVKQVLITGGTAAYVPAVVPEAQHTGIRAEALQEALTTLYSLTYAQAVDRYHIPLERAQVLPAGLAVIVALSHRFSFTDMEITHGGIREGAIAQSLYDAGIWSTRTM